MLILCTLLSACQEPIPPEETKQEIRHQYSTTHVAPDLDAICHNLKKEMQQMSAKRTTFALEEINNDIRLCLPLVTEEEQKHLMRLSDKMYHNFLTVDRDPEQQHAFDQYAFDQSPFPTIQQSHFEQLHMRDQYLLRHKGQAYIQLNDQGSGKTTYTRNSQYLAKVFAPYFPDAEKVFMIELGDQNQSPVLNKKTLLINPHEALKRALFWENYLNKFPKSPFKQDAQYLLNAYSNFFFLGSPDSPVSINFEGEIDIQATSLNEIQQLATNENSQLADQARRFLEFINLSSAQRTKLSSASNKYLNPNSQLRDYLNLQSFDFDHTISRDCFKDAICHAFESKSSSP